MNKVIATTAAPAAIGTYSQAVIHNKTLYISGQIPLDPTDMVIIAGDFQQQFESVLQNLSAICEAAGTELNNTVKFTIYLKNLSHFIMVNKTMQHWLRAPYPARSVVEVSRLPKDVDVEMDAIISLPD